MKISLKLLEILVCPVCKKNLGYIESGDSLVCSICGLKFAVQNDIPVMLVEEENTRSSQ